MKEDDFLTDDFLRKLIQKTSLDEPSEDFVDKVMAGIQPGVHLSPVKKPFFLFLKSSWYYFVLAAGVVVFFLTSDFPFMQFFRDNEYMTKSLLPYFESLFTGFKNFFVDSKFTSMGLMIVAAGGLLFLFDYFFTRRGFVRHHYSA
jgi:hypothetical protein